MLLTISTTHRPATDLGFLLSKHPDRVQRFELAFGSATVLYPEATEDRCTAALLLDIDPVALVRGARETREGGPLKQYVNDRPYTANSLLSTAIARVLRSALGGRCKARPELANTAIPLEARLPVLPAGGEGFVRSLFEPLGYEVDLSVIPPDPAMLAVLGEHRPHYVDLTLRATTRLSTLLSHLYVLIPVLDGDKHYWVGKDEVDKLLRFGEEWLSEHPQRERIAMRYLRHQRSLSRLALTRMADSEAAEQPPTEDEASVSERQVEKPLRLNEVRLSAVVDQLRLQGVSTVVDLGCGDGKLMNRLRKVAQFTRILGVDVSPRALEVATRRIGMERLSERDRERIELLQGSLIYRDKRIAGFDGAALVEVIEHVEPDRLEALERSVFRFAAPRVVVVTTPNIEHNVRFEGLPTGRLRHTDHRFEWDRPTFLSWAERVAGEHGYTFTCFSVGEDDPEVGPPTQGATFVRVVQEGGDS